MKRTNVLVLIVLFLFSSLTVHAADGMNWFSKKKTEKTAEKTVQAAPAQAAPASVETKVSPAPTPSVDNNVIALRQRVANNRMMSDAQKDELIKDTLTLLPPGIDLQAKSSEQHLLTFEQVANDPNMKLDEKKTSLKTRLSEVKVEAKEIREAVKDEKPAATVETKELQAEVGENPKVKKSNFAR